MNKRPIDMKRITNSTLAKEFLNEQVELVKKQVKDGKVLLALSGGVDSSVVAALLIKAIGKNLVCVHVNHGLLRKDESKKVIEVFKNQSKKYDVTQYKSSSKNDIISEEDGDVTLLIGKYRGVSLYEVVKIDPNYVAYLIKHSKDRHLFEVVKKIYDQIKKEEKTTK